MQVGYAGGYDWIAGRWFIQDRWLRLEVLKHYSTSTGSNGPLPRANSGPVRCRTQNTQVLTHSLCVRQQLNRPDCKLQLTLAQ